MEQLLVDIIFWGVFVGGGTIFVIFAFTMAAKQYKRDKEKHGHSRKKTPVESAYTVEERMATVVHQSCCVKTIGRKTPETVTVFTVVFQTENGDTLQFNVPEEMYDGFAEGQTGVLSLVDGELYGFALKKTTDVHA